VYHQSKLYLLSLNFTKKIYQIFGAKKVHLILSQALHMELWLKIEDKFICI